MARVLTEEQKAAQRAYSKAWRLANPLTDEQKRIARERTTTWRLANPEKAADVVKKWHTANPEKVRKNKEKWNENNRQEEATRKKAWAIANPLTDQQKKRKVESTTRWRKTNSNKVADYEREYARANASKVNAKNARRKAMKVQATPQWADELAIVEAYELAQLRSTATGVEHHVDHIVPLRSGKVCGLHCEHNLRVIPGKENASKGNRHWPDMP